MFCGGNIIGRTTEGKISDRDDDADDDDDGDDDYADDDAFVTALPTSMGVMVHPGKLFQCLRNRWWENIYINQLK